MPHDLVKRHKRREKGWRNREMMSKQQKTILITDDIKVRP